MPYRLRFLTAFLLILALTTAALPGRLAAPYPGPLGPHLDDQVRDEYTRRQNEKAAPLALIGDSTLKAGVDPAAFEEALGRPALFLGIPGSSSAQWYLIFKNNLLQAEPRPQTVVILFRDSVLTTPDFRVTGPYFIQIDELAAPEDTELIERAYVRPLSPAERLAGRYLPLYSLRETLRARMENFARGLLPGALLGCDLNCVDAAQNETFAEEKLQGGEIVAIEEAESYLYSARNLNFAARVEDSFLPLIIDLARQNDIRLILVRAPTGYPPGSNRNDSPRLRAYAADLQAYLAERGVEYLSFFGDPRFPPRRFSDPVHMTAAGKRAFTPLLAEAIQGLLP